jgi:hypothetical protein
LWRATIRLPGGVQVDNYIKKFPNEKRWGIFPSKKSLTRAVKNQKNLRRALMMFGQSDRIPSVDFVNKWRNVIVTPTQEGELLSEVIAGKSPAIKPTPDDVAEELLKIKDFEGALGKLNVDKDGIVRSKAVVRMVKNGQFVTIK